MFLTLPRMARLVVCDSAKSIAVSSVSKAHAPNYEEYRRGSGLSIKVHSRPRTQGKVIVGSTTLT